MDVAGLEAGLDAEQHRAVTSTATPLAVLAPAGSGKTRVLTRRIAHRVAKGEIEPQHVLAVTFTRKAARELRDRLSAMGLRDQVTAGTFHALALAQLNDHARDHRTRPPRVVDRKRPLLEEVTGQHDRRSLVEIATEIEWAKARQIPPALYGERVAELRRRTNAKPDQIAEAYRRYEVLKHDRGLLDFDDLLLHAAQLIERDAEHARALRWRFRHLFVDEFQDVNPLQFRLLEAWRGDRYDLFVVGDPQQAIYTWNGADPDFLQSIHEHYPPIEVVQLRVNYRSTPQILHGAASVFAAAGLISDDVTPTNADGELPSLMTHTDERAEATAIARLLRRGVGPGRPWASQAVLVRTNAQLDVIREALRAARIPHQVRGADRLVDDPAIRRVLESFDADERPLSSALAEVDADPDAADHDAIEELFGRAEEFARQHRNARATEFSAWLRTNVDRRSGGGGDVVVLATFHAAKGLEWPTVHLAGLEQGYVPIGFARTREAKAEEARLLYVAMTRAEHTLYLHMAASRIMRGQASPRTRSPLLAHLPAAPPPRETEEDLDALDRARSALVARLRGTEAVEAALREWRVAAARRSRSAPESVLPEHVLRQVAKMHPTTHDDLLAIDGLGPIKVARFGDELLAALAAATKATR